MRKARNKTNKKIIRRWHIRIYFNSKCLCTNCWVETSRDSLFICIDDIFYSYLLLFSILLNNKWADIDTYNSAFILTEIHFLLPLNYLTNDDNIWFFIVIFNLAFFCVCMGYFDDYFLINSCHWEFPKWWWNYFLQKNSHVILLQSLKLSKFLFWRPSKIVKFQSLHCLLNFHTESSQITSKCQKLLVLNRNLNPPYEYFCVKKLFQLGLLCILIKIGVPKTYSNRKTLFGNKNCENCT